MIAQQVPSPPQTRKSRTMIASTVLMLTEALANECAATRRHAARRLGEFGPLACPATRALRAAAADDRPDVSDAAAAALQRINSSRA